MKSVGELVKQYREKKDFSQKELAIALGWDKSHSGQIISNIERGESPLPRDKFKKVCSVLEIPSELLFQAWVTEQKEKFWDAFV